MLISVVVPVHKVAAELPTCLDSLLGGRDARRQRDPDVQVVAVDDASPDGCGALLDERACLDPRLTVIHLTERVGPGAARVVGADAAAGEYLWFVDGDDALADGAVAAVCGRLRRLDPDVLLLGYRDWYPADRRRPLGAAHLPERPSSAGPPDDRAVVTLAQHPALLGATMTAWSKVLRRRFVRGLGTPFGPGIHEDVPVSCAALIAADRIGVCDRVCYHYRQRPGSFMATPSRQHFDIFASYAWVFDFLAAREAAGSPTGDAVRAAVFERAVWHYSTVLSSGLVPRRDRAEFFHRMAGDYQRYRPNGYVPPPGARGAKYRLVQRDAYRLYEALEPVNRLRVAVLGQASRRWVAHRVN